MTNPRTVHMEPMGPADTGMEVWEQINPEGLVSGEPVQRGHLYYSDKETGLEVGVWDCTPMTTRLEPYSVNEFMHVLEGSVTIVYADGSEDTIKAGESFIIPKGLACSWKQSEYIRKFFVIFDDPSGALADDPQSLRVIRPLAGWAGRWHGAVRSRQSGRLHDRPAGDDGAYLFHRPDRPDGGWRLGGGARSNAPPPRSTAANSCSLSKGSMTLKGDGEEFDFKTGEVAFVPVGAPYGWRSTETVRKIYCAFLRKEAAANAVEAAE